LAPKKSLSSYGHRYQKNKYLQRQFTVKRWHSTVQQGNA